MGIAQDVVSSADVAERQLPPAASAPENAGEERVAMLDHAAMTGLTQAGHGLEPAEDFFDPFTFLLTDRVARMTSGAVIDDAGGLARKMGSDLVVAQCLHKLLAVIAFVGPERDPLLPRNFFHHCDRGLALGPAVGRGHLAIDRDTVAVLHQHVPRVAELGFL